MNLDLNTLIYLGFKIEAHFVDEDCYFDVFKNRKTYNFNYRKDKVIGDFIHFIDVMARYENYVNSRIKTKEPVITDNIDLNKNSGNSISINFANTTMSSMVNEN